MAVWLTQAAILVHWREAIAWAIVCLLMATTKIVVTLLLPKGHPMREYQISVVNAGAWLSSDDATTLDGDDRPSAQPSIV